jgi:hypothetical protein
MYSDLMNVLSWISPLILVSGIVGAIVHWSNLSPIKSIITIFLVIFLGFDICSRYAQELFGLGNNLPFLSVYALVEFIFLSILYTRHLPTKKSKVLPFIAILGLVSILILSISILSPIIPLRFQMYEGIIANVFSLFFGLFFIYQMLNGGIETTKQQRALNNIIIMYSGIQFFMALTINFMVNIEFELVFFFWLVRLIALTIFYLILSQIIWQTGKMVTQ